jgi:hypothetical protein
MSLCEKCVKSFTGKRIAIGQFRVLERKFSCNVYKKDFPSRHDLESRS